MTAEDEFVVKNSCHLPGLFLLLRVLLIVVQLVVTDHTEVRVPHLRNMFNVKLLNSNLNIKSFLLPQGNPNDET